MAVNEASQGVIEGYHRWYYDTEVWKRTTFLGVPTLKSVSDLWNYQEILYERKPGCVIEFGTCFGGSALFFSTMLKAIAQRYRVLTVDINAAHIDARVFRDPNIEVLTASTTSPPVVGRIRQLRQEFPGNVFVILDSDHHKDHVLAEMTALRQVIVPGDYLVVEDGNLNGNPVLPGWGAGPMEAINEYERLYPKDYEHDVARETKFGFTFAPRGFLIRTDSRSA